MPLVAVQLSCGYDEHIARLQSPERATYPHKTRDQAKFDHVYKGQPLLHDAGSTALTLDTSGLPPERSAARIVAFVRAIAPA